MAALISENAILRVINFSKSNSCTHQHFDFSVHAPTQSKRSGKLKIRERLRSYVVHVFIYQFGNIRILEISKAYKF
jgi:hypothetical protein